MDEGIIYLITNKLNNKKYIGQTWDYKRRKKEHENYPCKYSYIDNAIQKYGKECFNWEIIDKSSNQNVLDMLERLHISRYESSKEEGGYNLRDGGNGGKLSNETKIKISKNNARFWLGKKRGKITQEQKEKISKTMKGKNHSNKTKIKMGNLKRGESLFGFTGAHYHHKNVNPWTRVWNTKISYNKHPKTFGNFNDPLSCEILHDLILNEIYS